VILVELRIGPDVVRTEYPAGITWQAFSALLRAEYPGATIVRLRFPRG
jgi:hypothetical protein